MNDITAMRRPAEPDWSTVTAEELIAFRDAENRVQIGRAHV